MDVKSLLVQNPFDKHGKQVHYALFKQFSAGKSITGKSHYVVALFLILRISQTLDKSGDRILGQTFIWWITVQLLMCYVPVFAVHDWRVFITFYLQTDQMKKLDLPISGTPCPPGRVHIKKGSTGISFRIIIVMPWCWSGKVYAKQRCIFMFNIKNTSHQTQIPHPAASPSLICLKQSAFQKLKGKEGENLIWSQNRSH